MQLRDDYIDKLQDAIKLWDIEHPIDVWWRDHHSIPFGSPRHLEADFISQHIWYEEQKFIRDMRDGKNPHEESSPIRNSRVKEIDNETKRMTNSEIDKAFEDLDISEIQKQMDEKVNPKSTETKAEKQSTLQSLMDKLKGKK